MSLPPNERPMTRPGGAVATPPSGYERETGTPTAEVAGLRKPPQSELRARRERFPALDGVRGIAILAVFLFHCSLRLKGVLWGVVGGWGWMGVDLFFVLSGFLITGILLDARNTAPRFYYGGFYGRRLLRICPAFISVMVALVLVPGLTGQSTGQHLQLVRYEAWYWAFLANALVAVHGWGGVIPQTSPFWSLAVEEQFYLIWPSIVRRLSLYGVLWLGIAIIIGVAALRCVLAFRGVGGTALYVLMPTRADLLAWGIVLAVVVRIRNGVALIRRFLLSALVAAALVLIAVVLRERSAMFSSRAMVVAGYPAIAMLAACFVAIAITREPAALRWSWLTTLGKVSYGLYLWHMIGIALVANFLSRVNGWLIPLAFVASLVPTLASWVLIEQPALALKRYAPMRALPHH